MKRIAVVGAGATGHALAGLLASRGHEVYLTDAKEYKDVLEETARNGVIRLNGTVTGSGRPKLVTTDVAQATAEAELIICCTISNRDEEVASMLAPYVRPDQAVLLSAGNGGSLIYDAVFREAGREVLLGEVGGNFFPCRLSADREATIGLPIMPKMIAAFPPENVPALKEKFSEVWEFRQAPSILYTAFDGPNLLCHMAGTLLNLAQVEQNQDFNLFQNGISGGVIRLLDALWQEKKRVFSVFGFEPAPSPKGMFEGILDPHNDTYRYFREMGGPDSLEHRYITEDVPLLNCFFISVARAMGVEVPLFESMLNLMETVTGKAFYKNGRTLENLGLSSMSRSELIHYFCI